MVDEGVFPKVNGDYLFASEANRLGRTPQIIATGSTLSVPSGTAFREVGSVLVGAGSFLGSTIGFLSMNFSTTKTVSNAYGHTFVRMRISGTNEENSHFISGNDAGGDDRIQGNINVFMSSSTSNDEGFFSVNGGLSPNRNGGIFTPYQQIKSTGSLNLLGSPFVIFIDTRNRTTGTGSGGVLFNIWGGGLNQ